VLRPSFRIPLWAAAALPVAAYALRSCARGSLRPDLPDDAIVLAVMLVVLLLAFRYRSAANSGSDDLPAEMCESHDPEGNGGQAEEV
jgi:hypothetical protein